MRQIKDAGQSCDDDQLEKFWLAINTLKNLTTNTKLYTILLGWYATESSFTLFTFTDIQNDEDKNDGKFLVQL